MIRYDNLYHLTGCISKFSRGSEKVMLDIQDHSHRQYPPSMLRPKSEPGGLNLSLIHPSPQI